MRVYDLQSNKAQSLPQKYLFYLKENPDSSQAKMAHSNTPPHVYARCGKICVMLPKCACKERMRGFSRAVVLMQPCQGDAVCFCAKVKKHFGLTEVDAIMNNC